MPVCCTAPPSPTRPPAGFENSWRVNCLGPFLGIRAALPQLSEAEGASIVNTCSTSAIRPFLNHAAYGSSKWALRGLTQAVAVELAPAGIRVNAVFPGPIATPMLDDRTQTRLAETSTAGRLGSPARGGRRGGIPGVRQRLLHHRVGARDRRRPDPADRLERMGDDALVDRLDPALRHLVAARTDLSEERLPSVRAFLNPAPRRRRRPTRHRRCRYRGRGGLRGRAGPALPRRHRRRGGVLPQRCVRARQPGHRSAAVRRMGLTRRRHGDLGGLPAGSGTPVSGGDRRRAGRAALDRRQRPELGHRCEAAGGRGQRRGSAGRRAGTARRRRSAPPIRFQLLHQPVLDDGLTSSKQEFSRTPGFDGPAARIDVAVLPGRRAAPGRCGCPPGRRSDRGWRPRSSAAPSSIRCGDEAVDHALRLMRAGVPAELHVVPGTCHGFDSLIPEWELSRQMFDLQGARAAPGADAQLSASSSRATAAW